MNVSVHLTTGLGGVGKTTLSAALAVGHARAGRRVCVITIDPARRLADALGIDHLGNDPTPVPLEGAHAGSLHAMMLDQKAAFDQAVADLSDSPEATRRLLANRYYRIVSERMAGATDYMAVETLHRLTLDGRWDLIVVDTPPAGDALDFLLAPKRLARLFDPSVLGVLLRPQSRLVQTLTRQGMSALSLLVGGNVVTDIGEFFQLSAGLAQAFRAHGQALEATLRSTSALTWLVVDASAPDRADARAFLEALTDLGPTLAGVFVNRVTEDPGLPEHAPRPPCPADIAPATWDATLDALSASAAEEAHRAARHAQAARQLVAQTGVPAWLVPERRTAPTVLAGLDELGRWLPPADPALVP